MSKILRQDGPKPPKRFSNWIETWDAVLSGSLTEQDSQELGPSWESYIERFYFIELQQLRLTREEYECFIDMAADYDGLYRKQLNSLTEKLRMLTEGGPA